MLHCSDVNGTLVHGHGGEGALRAVGFRIIADTSKPGPRGSAPVALMLVDSAQFDNFFASKVRHRCLLGSIWQARLFERSPP